MQWESIWTGERRASQVQKKSTPEMVTLTQSDSNGQEFHQIEAAFI